MTEVSKSSTQYAVKLGRASKKRDNHPSDHEANVLWILSDANVSPRIPRVIDYGYDKTRHSKALVLDLLGADLQFMHKNYGGRFNIKTTLLLATQLVRVPGLCSVSLGSRSFPQIPTIQYIHSKDFVCRDIKPGNMLLGAKDNN